MNEQKKKDPQNHTGWTCLLHSDIFSRRLTMEPLRVVYVCVCVFQLSSRSLCWSDTQEYYGMAVTCAFTLSPLAFVKAFKQFQSLNISTAQAVTFKLLLNIITLPTLWRSTNSPVLLSWPYKTIVVYQRKGFTFIIKVCKLKEIMAKSVRIRCIWWAASKIIVVINFILTDKWQINDNVTVET